MATGIPQPTRPTIIIIKQAVGRPILVYMMFYKAFNINNVQKIYQVDLMRSEKTDKSLLRASDATRFEDEVRSICILKPFSLAVY